jgi:hypothetical protein
MTTNDDLSPFINPAGTSGTKASTAYKNQSVSVGSVVYDVKFSLIQALAGGAIGLDYKIAWDEGKQTQQGSFVPMTPVPDKPLTLTAQIREPTTNVQHDPWGKDMPVTGTATLTLGDTGSWDPNKSPLLTFEVTSLDQGSTFKFPKNERFVLKYARAPSH